MWSSKASRGWMESCTYAKFIYRYEQEYLDQSLEISLEGSLAVSQREFEQVFQSG